MPAAAVAALLVIAAILGALALAREQVEFRGWPSPAAPDTPKVECGSCR